LTETPATGSRTAGIFPPVRVGERLLMDGVVENTPIGHAVRLGATTVWVLPSGGAGSMEKVPESPAGDQSADRVRYRAV